jgi:DNA repair photolyase
MDRTQHCVEGHHAAKKIDRLFEGERMEVKEVKCKSIMSKSGLHDSDFSINPYRGCEHNCFYCYAPFVLREKRPWGTFLEVKTNAADVLSKEILKNKSGNILISSVTDPYQSLEKKYKITREVLKKLNKDFFVSILTKSALVLRDLDLFRKLNCEVGMTITTLDEDAAKVFEPNSSLPEERLDALSYIKVSGIKTYIFFGPLLPFISDVNLEKTISRFSMAKPDKIYVDRLNIKRKDHWEKIKAVLAANYPDMVDKWEKVLFSENDYYEKLKQRIVELFQKYDLKYELCY